MSIHMIEPRCLTSGSIGTKYWFQALFVRRENGFVGAVSCFVPAGFVKPVHGSRSARDQRLADTPTWTGSVSRRRADCINAGLHTTKIIQFKSVLGARR